MTKLPARPLAKLEKVCAEARSSDELLGGVGALLAREADANAFARRSRELAAVLLSGL